MFGLIIWILTPAWKTTIWITLLKDYSFWIFCLLFVIRDTYLIAFQKKKSLKIPFKKSDHLEIHCIICILNNVFVDICMFLV